MANFIKYDPLTSEAQSSVIAGITGALNKLSSALNLKTTVITDVQMTEIFIAEDDRYRFYQVEIEQKGWLSEPAPIVKKNGTIINSVTDNFEINYLGGSIEFVGTAEQRPTASDVITVSATYVNNVSTVIEAINASLNDLGVKANKYRGTYKSLDTLKNDVENPLDGDYAMVSSSSGTKIYVYNINILDWEEVGKETDLTQYYTKAEIDTALGNKEPKLDKQSDLATSDDFYYGGRKTWISVYEKIRTAILTGLSTSVNSTITATDTLLSALGKLQSQITANKNTATQEIEALDNGKVDKVVGKGLSTNDLTDELVVKINSGSGLTEHIANEVNSEQGVHGIRFFENKLQVDLDGTWGDMIEVTPPQGTPLNDFTWEQIKQISDAGQAENYFAIGDRKEVVLNGTCGTLALNTTLYAYIIGFDHNASREGAGISFGTFKTSITGGTDVALVDSVYGGYGATGVKNFNMNHGSSNSDSTNIGGWKGCDMRFDVLGSVHAKNIQNANENTATSPVSNTLMSCLPAELRAVLKPITKWTDNTGGGSDTASYVTSTTDYLPLLAEFEVHGERRHANSAEQNYQSQYRYFINGNSKIKYQHSTQVSVSNWWVRSTYSISSTYFALVNTGGAAHISTASRSSGVAPAFLI